MANLF